jgi:hypothetical protein
LRAARKTACFVLAALIALPLAGWSGKASAQGADTPIVLAQAEPIGRQPGLFRFLFGGNRQTNDRQINRNSQPGNTVKKRRKSSTATARGHKAVASAPKAVVAVEKAADAKRVIVVGDFMAKALAKGLGEAFAENPGVVVIDASNGSSGLVRDDFYDWNTRLPEIAAAESPDLVVVMIGANDRQEISSASAKIAKGTPQWSRAYAGRVSALIQAIAATGKPALWAGLVPVKSNSLSRDYSAFNSIFREKTDAAGITFVASWDGFADDEGRYVTSGPDINGQQRGLRTKDGLNFTKAGRRKLAFFVERDVLRLLKSDAIPVLATLTPDGTQGAVKPQRILIGPMVPVGAVSLTGNSELSSFGEAPAIQSGGAIEMIVSGAPPDGAGAEPAANPLPWPPQGRADDFRRPGPQ